MFNVLLLWSGGCDSTALLHDLLFETGKFVYPAEGRQIRTIAVNHYQVGAIKENQNARNRYIEFAKERGKEWDHIEITVSQTGATQDTKNNGGLYHPAFWLPHAVVALNDYDYLITGWIRGDDVWSHKEQILSFVKMHTSMIFRYSYITFPLEYFRKYDVIQYLKDQGIYDLTWYCESPVDGEACKKCVPCLTHELNLKAIELGLTIKTPAIDEDHNVLNGSDLFKTWNW